MSDSKPLPFDDEDYDVPSQPRKRSPALLWVVLGVGGAVCLLVGGFWLTRVKMIEARRAEEEARMEADLARATVEIKLAQERAIAEAKARGGVRPEGPMGPSPEQTRNMLPIWLQSTRLHPTGVTGNWHWSFSVEGFVLQADKGSLPPDLLKAFLEPDQSASLIEGKWRLEDNNRMLTFSDLRIDGKAKVGQTKQLRIEPEGPKHVKIGDHQYLISEGKP
ncbi:MAG TPA: hypothetical protein VG097_15280 [Gemmata sp.]|jgi:hypothetical protein|nr:hypothetical protein [Gemmata sp.]